MNYGNRQGGSAATFIIVGLVLTVLTAGVLYGARQYMASQRTAPISEESMQTAPEEQQSDQSGSDNTSGNQSSDEKEVASNSNDADNAQTSDDTNKTEAPTDSDDTTHNSTSGSTSESVEKVETVENSDAPLPQTGSTENAFVALVFGVATASTVAYSRSQRMI